MTEQEDMRIDDLMDAVTTICKEHIMEAYLLGMKHHHDNKIVTIHDKGNLLATLPAQEFVKMIIEGK